MSHPARIRTTVDRIVELGGGGPCRTRDLLSAGLTPAQLRAAASARQLLALRRGIVVPVPIWQGLDPAGRHECAARAALLAYPGAYLSHDSAARIHGLPTDGPVGLESSTIPAVHITRTGLTRRDEWLSIHGCDDVPGHVHQAPSGLMTTDLIRTSIELAADRSYPRAVAFIDAGMRLWIDSARGQGDLREAVHHDDLRRHARRAWRDALGHYGGHRWVTRVRLAVETADPAAESVFESLSRARIIEAGLPVPDCGVRLVGDDGRTYWVDMLWPSARLIGEADGLSKYTSVSDLLAEKRRQEALMGRGYRFTRWGWSEVVPDPAAFLARISQALQQPAG